MIKVGVVGGTGYTGVELLRILARHPEAQLAAITSRKEARERASALPMTSRSSGSSLILAATNLPSSSSEICSRPAVDSAPRTRVVHLVSPSAARTIDRAIRCLGKATIE